jgi:hypothetical protein
MTIGQALGAASNRLPEDVARRAIRGIIDENPAFQQAVNDKVAAIAGGTTEEKRNKAISDVYGENYLFRDEVNWSLRQLLRNR